MTKDDLSGADIKAVCTEAGLLALRERRMRVNKADFTAAREKVTVRLNLLDSHSDNMFRCCTGRMREHQRACTYDCIRMIDCSFCFLRDVYMPARVSQVLRGLVGISLFIKSRLFSTLSSHSTRTSIITVYAGCARCTQFSISTHGMMSRSVVLTIQYQCPSLFALKSRDGDMESIHVLCESYTNAQVFNEAYPH